VSLDQGAQAEPLVQLPGQRQPDGGGHRRAAEFDAKLGIEREANRVRFRVTHWVVPSAPARTPTSRVVCGRLGISAWSVQLSKQKCGLKRDQGLILTYTVLPAPFCPTIIVQALDRGFDGNPAFYGAS